jgi:LysR family transcriptional regulator, glycine cleavage system transcriptional activator
VPRVSVTPAAIGQRIKALEDYLGLELLLRGRTGIRPSRELLEAMPHLTAAFEQLGAAAERLEIHRGDEIHVIADSDLAELWLAPRLEAYRMTIPNTHFCINGIGDARLRLGKADCEIKFSEISGEGNEVVLFRDYLVPLSSRENARRIGALPSERRLDGFPLLHLDCYHDDPDAIGWPDWIARFGHRTSDPRRGIRYQRIAHALSSALGCRTPIVRLWSAAEAHP